MGGGCPSVRWSGGTYADEALSVSAAALLSATSSWLMAHLRLFQPHRGTQSLRFPDHDFPVMRTYAAPAAQTPSSGPLQPPVTSASNGAFGATRRAPATAAQWLKRAERGRRLDPDEPAIGNIPRLPKTRLSRSGSLRLISRYARVL